MIAWYLNTALIITKRRRCAVLCILKCEIDLKILQNYLYLQQFTVCSSSNLRICCLVLALLLHEVSAKQYLPFSSPHLFLALFCVVTSLELVLCCYDVALYIVMKVVILARTHVIRPIVYVVIGFLFWSAIRFFF